MTASTGVYQYSCAATCSAGSSNGVTTECCYATADCNTIRQVTSCYVGTDATASITSCSNSVYCKVTLEFYILRSKPSKLRLKIYFKITKNL
jgi:hypothetical protein